MRRIGRDPLNARGYRTQRPELPEDLWQPLYDRINVATTVPSQLSYFANPRGQSVTLITASAAATKTKTYRDTNMENSNVIPTKLFKFVGVSLAFVHSDRDNPKNAEDREMIRDGGYFHIRIVDKDILYVPNVAIPELNPITAVGTTVTATSIMATAGGGGQNVPMYKFPIPITLEPFQSFNVELNFDGTITLSNTMDIYVIMQGFMRRPT